MEIFSNQIKSKRILLFVRNKTVTGNHKSTQCNIAAEQCSKRQKNANKGELPRSSKLLTGSTQSEKHKDITLYSLVVEKV